MFLLMILFITCVRNTTLYVGERTAEKIKIQIGAATEDLELPPEDMSVQGRDLLNW